MEQKPITEKPKGKELCNGQQVLCILSEIPWCKYIKTKRNPGLQCTITIIMDLKHYD